MTLVCMYCSEFRLFKRHGVWPIYDVCHVATSATNQFHYFKLCYSCYSLPISCQSWGFSESQNTTELRCCFYFFREIRATFSPNSMHPLVPNLLGSHLYEEVVLQRAKLRLEGNFVTIFSSNRIGSVQCDMLWAPPDSAPRKGGPIDTSGARLYFMSSLELFEIPKH